jgi:hypothetical protein
MEKIIKLDDPSPNIELKQLLEFWLSFENGNYFYSFHVDHYY